MGRSGTGRARALTRLVFHAIYRYIRHHNDDDDCLAFQHAVVFQHGHTRTWAVPPKSLMPWQEQEERPLLQNTQSESPYKAGLPSPTMGRLHSGAARALSRDFPTRTLSGPGALQHDLQGGPPALLPRLSKHPCGCIQLCVVH